MRCGFSPFQWDRQSLPFIWAKLHQKRPALQIEFEKEHKRPKLNVGSELVEHSENNNLATVAQQLMKQQAYFQELQVKQQMEFQKTIAKMFEKWEFIGDNTLLRISFSSNVMSVFEKVT